jgi:transmembrane sensor
MNEQERLQYLFQRCYEKIATTAERAEFLSLVSQTQHEEAVNKLIEATYSLQPVNRPDEQTSRSILAAILDTQNAAPVPIHRIHLLKTAWFRYAASIIILFGIGSYLYISNQKEKPSVTQNNSVPVQNDVAPGGNKAILTLADGSKIVLDSAKSGQLAREANATITKTADGRIVYNADEKLGSRLLFNTMGTPRGGQYQLTLPDGTQVWLNAESSITYPTAFTGKERKVTITGEAYFEVAKNKAKPFKVDIGSATIEVVGTHFNVNTYKEEPASNITLLEGSVRIKTVHTSLTLKPGQQGQLTDRGLFLAANPDVEQVMAWKNGLFNFNRTPLDKVLTQLSRWYDVDVQYANGKIPVKKVSGEMQRSLTLSQVLNILKGLEIKYRIEGKKLIVL